jgi:glutathione S-transferase
LSFVCSDLHKSIGGFFSISKMSEDPAIQKVVRHYMVERAHENLKYVDDRLAGKSYLMGEQFTPADAYAFIVLGWTQWIDVSLTPYSHIQKFMACVKARPAVAAVLKSEGLT